MAAGDFTFFNQYKVDVGLEAHQLNTDELKFAVIDDSVVPAAGTTGPHFGGTGTTDLSSGEQTGGDVSAGGYVIANTSYVLSGSGGLLDGDNVVVSPNGANPSAVDYAIIYNNTDPNKRAIGFVELAPDTDLTLGYNFNFNAGGIGTHT